MKKLLTISKVHQKNNLSKQKDKNRKNPFH